MLLRYQAEPTEVIVGEISPLLRLTVKSIEAKLTVVVTDGKSKEPVPNATVKLDELEVVLVTDDNGEATFEGLTLSSVGNISVTCEGFVA